MANIEIPLIDLKLQHQNLLPEIMPKLESLIANASFIGGVEKDLFEKEFAALNGSPFCIGVANGTDALFLIMKALGLQKGDHVITAANSFIASSETISAVGATPVFVDVNPENYLIDLNQYEKILEADKTAKKIKAAIVVHLYGQIIDMPRLMEISNRYNVKVIEDCAQAHLAEIENKKCGTWGVAGSFSFYPGKNLGAAGDAGAVLCNDEALAQKIKMFANHGRVDKYNHVFEGYNSRLDNIQAAVLRIKLKYLTEWTKLRQAKAAIYEELLSGVSEVIRPKLPPVGRHVFHLYTVRVKNRDRILAEMKKQGIEASIHYPIMLPALKAYEYLGLSASQFPVSNVLQNEIMSLPLYPEITLEQQKRVVEALKQALRNVG